MKNTMKNTTKRRNRLAFVNDYMEGAHPSILEKLMETNMTQTNGYGLDPICERARDKIRRACGCPGAEVHFLVGGTQTNAVVIDALLRSYQGVIAAESGHINTHEAGAIEHSGHKVITLPHDHGKITADQIRVFIEDFYGDDTHDHIVMPGMVYLSQPTEYGTLYSRSELISIREVCKKYDIPLYVDGARLAYALACPDNDVTLADLASLCDVFYIGGTKCGALFGEAVIIPQQNLVPRFFTIMKQHGALLAKGRILGIQFDALFTDGLYQRIGEPAIRAARRIKEILAAHNLQLYFDTPTNQIFVVIENARKEKLARHVDFSFWEKLDDDHTVIRFASSWATRPEAVEQLDKVLTALADETPGRNQ